MNRLLQLLLVILGGVAHVASAGEFAYCVARHEPGGQPFVYTPAAPPKCSIQLAASGTFAIKHTCWTDSFDGIYLGVTRRPIGHKRFQYWLWMRIPDKYTHEPLTFDYAADPVFIASEWYNNFWNWFQAESKFKDHIDVEQASSIIWNKFVKVCPKSFVDLMKYEYRLEGPAEYGSPAVQPTIDLVAGMKLRVETVTWQNPPRVDDQHLFRGYVASGPTFLSINRLGDNLGFDPFIGHLERFMQVPETTSNDLQGSGSIDLHTQLGERRPIYRLAYPTTIVPSNVPGQAVANQIVVVGGFDRVHLSANAIQSVLGRLEWDNGAANDPDGHRRTFFTFRGRASVVPEVMIRLPKNDEFVAVGTTLGQIIDRKQDWEDKTLCSYTCLWRQYEGKLVPVKFAGCDRTLYDLPLLKGDFVKW